MPAPGSTGFGWGASASDGPRCFQGVGRARAEPVGGGGSRAGDGAPGPHAGTQSAAVAGSSSSSSPGSPEVSSSGGSMRSWA